MVVSGNANHLPDFQVTLFHQRQKSLEKNFLIEILKQTILA